VVGPDFFCYLESRRLVGNPVVSACLFVCLFVCCKSLILLVCGVQNDVFDGH
jgi:hypothetical protein